MSGSPTGGGRTNRISPAYRLLLRAVQRMDTTRLLLEQHLELATTLAYAIAKGTAEINAEPPMPVLREFVQLSCAIESIPFDERYVAASPTTNSLMLWILIARIGPMLKVCRLPEFSEAITDWQESMGVDAAARRARRRFFKFLGLNDRRSSYRPNMTGFIVALLQHAQLRLEQDRDCSAAEEGAS